MTLKRNLMRERERERRIARLLLALMTVAIALMLCSCSDDVDPSTKGFIAPSWAIGYWVDEDESTMKLEITSDNITGSLYVEGYDWVKIDMKAMLELGTIKITKQTSSDTLWEIHDSGIASDGSAGTAIMKITKTSTGISYYELDSQDGQLTYAIDMDLIPGKK